MGIFLMILSIVLLPLGIYFVFFTFIFCRRYPTLFSGGFDVGILLVCVLGLVSFGPGKLLIPAYVYNMWGVWAIIYWLLIYYLASYCICNACRNYVVIYNCDFEEFMHCIADVSKRLDRRFFLEERTLHLPKIGLHCVIGGSYYNLLDKLKSKLRTHKITEEDVWKEAKNNYSRYIFLQLTGSPASDPVWELFKSELAEACHNVKNNTRKLPILYGFIAGSILVFSLANITTDLQTLQNIFIDYWN
ncbi:MAG: hypothetical protein LBP59_16795 [Planctomycetaceae bacterium]|jgi:hypothetical protein|nr:hypothetical protein [Planctomycetaceae bacterium]